jgi:hypothetical protein
MEFGNGIRNGAAHVDPSVVLEFPNVAPCPGEKGNGDSLSTNRVDFRPT